MLRPRALRSGDRVAVVAPASAFDRAEFDAGVAELVALGFEPVFDDRVFEREGYYVAGPAATRAAAINDALTDRSVAAIIAVRGGYGSAQILPHLSADVVRAGDKPIVGYSDVTALLTFVTQAAGLVAFHGPMLVRRLGRGEAGYDRASFLNVLIGDVAAGELGAGTLEAIRPGEVAGPLAGGTLTQLVSSLGTPFAFDPPDGHILFLDEVNERPYRIDRMLVQLDQAGILARASAIVFGELPGCDERGGRPTAKDLVIDSTRGFDGPVVIGLPSGHTTGPGLTLPLGVGVRVIAGADNARFIVEEAAVRAA